MGQRGWKFTRGVTVLTGHWTDLWWCLWEAIQDDNMRETLLISEEKWLKFLLAEALFVNLENSVGIFLRVELHTQRKTFEGSTTHCMFHLSLDGEVYSPNRKLSTTHITPTYDWRIRRKKILEWLINSGSTKKNQRKTSLSSEIKRNWK